MPEDHTAQRDEQLQSPTQLRRGTVLDGKYEITDYLGSGGMGAVYKARQTDFDRSVAIKTLHARFTSDVSAVKRFQREARIISGLTHKNILAVYSFGGHQDFIYLAMEFVQGTSLGRMLAEKGKMAPEQALPILLQICDGMEHAHKHEVLHRDLKPDNVMIVTSGLAGSVVKVVDFGLAKLMDGPDGQRLTRTGEVVGDPRYMSPEQCRGETLDVRSDIYSFGCLMYEVLTGKWPFDADDPVAILHKHIEQDPEPFAKRLGLPPAIEAITFTAMAKNAKDRYESFGAVAKALQDFASNPNAKVAAPARRARGKKPSRLALAGIAIAVGVIAVSGAAALFVSPSDWSILPTKLQYQAASAPGEKIKTGMQLGEYYLAHNSFDEAASHFSAVNKLAESTSDREASFYSNAGLSQVFAKQGRESDASSAAVSAIATGLNMINAGNTDRKVCYTICTVLPLYSRSAPGDMVAAAHEVANVYITHKQLSNARTVLEQVAPIGNGAARTSTLILLGDLSLRMNDRAKAQQYFGAAAAMAESAQPKAVILQMVGARAMAGGDGELAADYFKQALQLTPKAIGAPFVMLQLQVADCYASTQNLRAAKQAYSDALANARTLANAEPLVIRSLHGLGQVEYHLADQPAAEKTFREEIAVLQANPKSDTKQIVDAICMVGDSLTMQKQFYKSASEFQQALEVIDKTPQRGDIQAMRPAVEKKFHLNDDTFDPSRPKKNGT